MKNRMLFFSILLLGIVFTYPGYSQEDPYDLMGTLDKTVNLPPSPEVAAFVKYGETPVNLYSGTPTISIPIYVLQGQEMSLPISLSYDASGIKVDQIATNVGLGWNLNFGGVVSRKVNHLPDQLTSGDDYEYPIHSSYFKDWQNYFYTGTTTQSIVGNHSAAVSGSLIQFYKKYHKGAEIAEEVDTQADMFSFNVNGLSGTIIIDYQKTDTSGNPLAYCFENPDIKVAVDATLNSGAVNSEIYSWNITNVDGTQYFFDKAELTWNEYSTDAVEYVREYKSAWHLSKVTSPNGLDVFNFSYSSPQNWNTPAERKEKKMVYRTSINDVGNYITSSQIPAYNRYENKSIHLTGITYNGGSVSVSTASRVDLPGLKRYTQLQFKDENGDLVQNVDFQNTDYFRVSPSQTASQDNATNSRLKLDEILIYRDDSGDARKYSFSYIDEDQVPSRQCTAMDYWGYYRGGDCSLDLTADAKILDPSWPVSKGRDRSPVFSFTDNGSLESITYPTGGKTVFEYEPHRGLGTSNDAVNGVVGGLRLKRTVNNENDTNDVLTQHYFYNDLEAKINDGTYTIGTNLAPGMLDTNYDTSGKVQQILTFAEVKVSYSPPGAQGGGGTSSEWYQYASNLAAQAPQNVTYGAVTEIIFRDQDFEGATVNHFHNDFYLSGGAFPMEPFVDRTLINGEAETIKVFGNSNGSLKLLRETLSEFGQDPIVDTTYSAYQGIFLYHDRAAGPAKTRGCMKAESTTDPNIDFVSFEDQIETCLGNNPPQCAWGCPNQNSQSYASYIEYKVNRYELKQQWKKLLRTVTKTYEGATVMTDTVDYQYNSSNHYLTTKVKSTDSKGILSETDILYPEDAIGTGDYSASEETVLTGMVNRNMINQPILVKKFYDNALLSTQKVYNGVASTTSGGVDVIRPTSVEVAKGNLGLEVRRVYHSYDADGNLTEVSTPNGSRTYYIWGYNGKQLLAEIRNKPSSNIPPAIASLIASAQSTSDTENSAVQEDSLRSQLNTIRNQAYFSESLVTTFTYDPGIGVTSVTDPRGYVMTYQYDQHNRLVSVKDADGNLVGENEYIYRVNN
ncbi:MAG: RHS repeat domain-containing protein [Bacteroidota bacterium]